MPLNPSRRDTIGPPRRSKGDVGKDLTDLSALVRHHGSYLRSLNPGMLGGRWQSPKPIPLSGPSQLVGDDGGAEADTILFENTDTGVSSGPGHDILINLSHVPEEGSEQVFYNGIGIKRADWSRTDSLLTIPAEPWFRAGKIAWVHYAYYEEQIDQVDATFVDVSWVVQDSNTTIPIPGTPTAGDLLLLQIAVNGSGTCTDSRFTPHATYGPGGTWLAIDDGSGTPVSIHMDSAATAGGQDSVAVLMRIRGNPLLPLTDEHFTTASSITAFPLAGLNTGAAFGILGISCTTGLVSASIGGDTLGHWTTQKIQRGDGPGRASVYVGTAPGTLDGNFTNFGSNAAYYAWMGGIQ